jgi:ADP-heptose:LPS heptosyltransferase
MKIMLRMKHGLGDNVQLQIVVAHLQHYYPDAEITVETNYPEIFREMCRTEPLSVNFNHTKWKYDQAHYIHFARPDKCYVGHPSTKAARCLIEEFGLKPIDELFYYGLEPNEEERRLVDEWQAKVGLTGKKLVAVHYQGVSSPERKDLEHNDAGFICDGILESGFVPVVIDYDEKSPLPDGEKIFRFNMPPNVMTLAALLERCECFFAIDSGPLHIAAALSVPTVALWLDFWPGHNIDPAPNVCHWFEASSLESIEGEWREVDGGWTNDNWEYFVEHYQYNECNNVFCDLMTLFKNWREDAAKEKTSGAFEDS